MFVRTILSDAREVVQMNLFISKSIIRDAVDNQEPDKQIDATLPVRWRLLSTRLSAANKLISQVITITYTPAVHCSGLQEL